MPPKAASNLVKHGVSFSEAMTVFGDPLEAMIQDPANSAEESGFVSIGLSEAGRCSSSPIQSVWVESALLARAKLLGRRGNSMNPRHPEEADDILPEYDFTQAVRGKHHESYRRGQISSS